MANTVADLLWEMLQAAGVSRCYGNVEDALNPVIAALHRHAKIEFIHVRHEEYGVFAAVAEASLTGNPVAVCGTAGPGAAFDQRTHGRPQGRRTGHRDRRRNTLGLTPRVRGPRNTLPVARRPVPAPSARIRGGEGNRAACRRPVRAPLAACTPSRAERVELSVRPPFEARTSRGRRGGDGRNDSRTAS